VFVFLTAERTGLPERLVFPARIAVTAVLTAALALAVEEPVRRRRVLRRPAAGIAAAAVGVVVLVGTAVLTASVVEPQPGLAVGPGSSGPTVYLRSTTPDVDEPADDEPATALVPDAVPTVEAPATGDPLPSDAARGIDLDEVAAAAAEPTVPTTLLVLGGSDRSTPVVEADARWTITDGRRAGCPLVAVRTSAEASPAEGCPTSADLLAAAPAPSTDVDRAPLAILAVVGAEDLAAVADAADGRAEMQGALRSFVRELRAAGHPVVLHVDHGVEGADRSLLAEVLTAVAAVDRGITVIDASRSDGRILRGDTVHRALDAVGALDGDPNRGASSPSERVLVLGDSTGVALSRLLHERSGGRIETIGLAQEGCPLLAADEIRWWDGVEFDLDTCPDLDVIVDHVRRYRPTTVLVAASLMEQADYRDRAGEWFDPADPEYRRRHEVLFAEVERLAAEVGAEVLLLDSPAITGGDFAGSPMARPERIAAWNTTLAERAAGSAGRVRVLPWAAAVAALEAERGTIRPDGVHLEDGPLGDLLEMVVIPAL
jgi:hypothetical protein